jgi:hypothetical protein
VLALAQRLFSMNLLPSLRDFAGFPLVVHNDETVTYVRLTGKAKHNGWVTWTNVVYPIFALIEQRTDTTRVDSSHEDVTYL